MSKKKTNCDLTGHDPGAEAMSADERRREYEMYGPEEDAAYEPQNLNEKERAHAGRDDAGTNWPHKDAYDIGGQLTKAEAENASLDQNRTENAAEKTLGKQPRDLDAEVGRPGTSDDRGAGIKRNERNLEPSRR